MLNIAENKKLILNPSIANVDFEYFSVLNRTILLILSSKIKVIKEIDLRNIYLGPYEVIFPKLLEELKSLEKLKLDIHNSYDVPIIIKTIINNLESISHLNIKFESVFTGEIIKKLCSERIHKTLRKLKLTNYSFMTNSCVQEDILNNFIAQSQLVSLDLSYVNLNYEHIHQLTKGLDTNQTLTCLRLQNIKILKQSKFYFDFDTNPEQLMEIFLILFSTLEQKIHFKRLTLLFPEFSNIKCSKDRSFKLLIGKIERFLAKNQNLIEFNVAFKIPDIFLLVYSDIILKALQENESLEIIFFFYVREFMFAKRIKIKSICKIRYRNNNMDSFTINMNDHYIITLGCIYIVYSEIIKKYHPNCLNQITRVLFETRINKSQTLILKKPSKSYRKSIRNYILNYLDTFTWIKELVINDFPLKSSQIAIIAKNIEKLESLQTVKVCGYNFKIGDASGFLAPKNLTYLKFTNTFLDMCELEKFSQKIKTSRIEKLTLKRVTFTNNPENPLNIIETIICNSLKTLKIYKVYDDEYYNKLLYNLILKLDTFVNLEYIGMSISKNHLYFIEPMRYFVSLIYSKKTLLSKIKICEYIWNIKKLNGKKDLKFSKCKFGPGDLMLFAELCEKRVLKDVSCVNLSGNMGIIDENFCENIAKIVRFLECKKVVIESSRCTEEHINEIKSLLADKQGSLVDFIITTKHF